MNDIAPSNRVYVSELINQAAGGGYVVTKNITLQTFSGATQRYAVLQSYCFDSRYDLGASPGQYIYAPGTSNISGFTNPNTNKPVIGPTGVFQSSMQFCDRVQHIGLKLLVGDLTLMGATTFTITFSVIPNVAAANINNLVFAYYMGFDFLPLQTVKKYFDL